MKITIVYDNNAREGLKSGWGFSCFIEDDKKILFDTGDDSEKLLFNMEKLDIKLEDIDVIVLSHEHWDHAGGLNGLLEIIPKVRVIKPNEFSEVKKITEEIYSTGKLDGIAEEQSLIVKTEKGNIVITGCAHPGLKKIIEKASSLGKIYGIIGGFHGFKEFDFLKGIKLIAPCHCTQHIDEIKKHFPAEFKEIMAGDIINA